MVLGSFSLGNALPELQTFAVAFGAAAAVFEVIDKVFLQIKIITLLIFYTFTIILLTLELHLNFFPSCPVEV